MVMVMVMVRVRFRGRVMVRRSLRRIMIRVT